MPLLNKNLTDDLGKIFKYPVSITQSVKGFFREMDTYGKINQKSILETVIVLSEYVNELAKVEINVNSKEQLLSEEINKIQNHLIEIDKQLQELTKKPVGRPPAAK